MNYANESTRSPASNRYGTPGTEYPTANPLDVVITEGGNVRTGVYDPIGYGTPHHRVPTAILCWQGNIKGNAQDKAPIRIYANLRLAQEVDNLLTQDDNQSDPAFPRFPRSYLFLRNGYTAATPLAPLTSLIGLRLNAGGSGYGSNGRLALSFTGGAGTGAAGFAEIVGGAVVAVVLTNSGTGYTSAPTVSIAGGTGASITALLQPTSAVLTSEVETPAESPFTSIFVQVTRIYETLPGPIVATSESDPETGIPVLVTKQLVSSTEATTGGTFAPVAFTIASATVANPTVITTSAPHDFTTGEYIVIAGNTNTTPTIVGTHKVTVLSPTTISIPINVTARASSGAGGTTKRYAYFVREIQETGNINTRMKIESRIMTGDISAYNEDVPAQRAYDLPDLLQEINYYTDESDGEAVSNTGDDYTASYNESSRSSVGFKILSGYRGPCLARRKRYFFPGPPPDGAIPAPFVIMPSRGTVTVSGGAHAESWRNGEQISFSDSTNFDGITIPPVLTGAFSGAGKVGLGAGVVSVDLPASIPENIYAGDEIPIVEEPQKWRLGAWSLIVWVITIPENAGPPAPP